MLREINDEDFEKEIAGGKTPTAVSFSSEWCPGCKVMAPILERLAGDFEGKMKLVKIDVTKNTETAARLGVLSIPTVIFFREGKETGRITGVTVEEKMRKKTEEFL